MSRYLRIAACIILCAVIGIALGSGPALGAGETHTVSPGESIEDTIQSASPGDTIRIENGTYDERVNVTTSNITIRGVGGSPVIDGTQSNVSVVNVTASNVTFRSITVTGGEGIGVVDEDDYSVSETGNGIIVTNAPGVEMYNVTITGNEGWGIYYSNSPRGRVVNSTLTDNVWDGVIFVYSNGSVARNNLASGNGLDDCDYYRCRHGIRFSGTSHGRIANNTAVGNAYGGVLFTGNSSNNTVRNNVMRNNGDRGLGTFAKFRQNRVVNNTIVNNAQYGILTYTPGGNNTFAHNVVRNNGGTGISAYQTYGNTIRNNTVVGHNYVGIGVSADNGSVIANNTVSRTDTFGISVSNTDEGRVRDNTITDNGVGVRLTDDMPNLTVADNVIRRNDQGVIASPPAQSGAVVSYNTIANNSGYDAVVYRGQYYEGNRTFTTVLNDSADVPPLNATNNYWGNAGTPTQGAADTDAESVVSAKVIYEPALDEPRNAPRSLTSVSMPESAEQPDDAQSNDGDETDGGDEAADSDETTDESNDASGDGESSDDGENTSESTETGDTDASDDTGGNDDADTTPTASPSASGPGFGLLAGLVALTIFALAGRRD